MSTEFKWTADLLAEFIKDYGDRSEPVAELMERFKASKQPKTPNIITEDGVGYYEGEKKEIFCTHKRDGEPGAWHIDSHPEYYSQLLGPDSYEHFFSTKQAAEEWIYLNKKSISINDLKEVFGTRDFIGMKFLFDHLMDKLNKP